MNRLGLILFILIIIYFIFFIRQDIMNNLELKQQIQRVTIDIEQGNERDHYLTDRLNRLQGDRLIEELARTRLGFVKKAEKAYKVIGR